MPNERSQSGVFVVLGVIVLVLAGFGIRRIVHRPPQPVPIPAPDPDPSPASPSATINFYLDDSGSMLHFLTAPADPDGDSPPNYFKQFLDKVGTTLSDPPGEVGWSGKTHFLRFGAGISPVPGGDPHEMSLNAGNFFHASQTSIEKAIDDKSIDEGDDQKPEVKVIVTDLYENGGKIEKPAKALAKRYLSSDADPGGRNAVDILAVRNPHDGDVEDLPGAAPKQVVHNAADTMPFYVIVAGPTADVRHVMKVLLDGTGLSEAKKKNRATEFLFTRTPLSRGKDDMKPGGDGRFSETDEYKERGIPFMHLRSGALEMSWPDTVKLPDGVVDLYGDKDNQQLRVTVQQAQADTQSPAVPAKWLLLPASPAIVDECAHPDLLCKRIDHSKLPSAGTYILRFDRVVARRTAALDPGSPDLKDWNIEEADAEAIGHAAREAKDKKSSSTGRDPKAEFADRKGLTPDLSKFLNTLDGAMFREAVPITTYYVYLQSE